MSQTVTKPALREEAKKTGIDYIGFAPAARWNGGEEFPNPLHPQTVWPQVKTVIVLGAPIWLPLIEAAPSVLGREQLFVTNRLLEKTSYRLASLLQEGGFQALNIPVYSTVPETEKTGEVPYFPVEAAAYYSGLGTVGRSHRFITESYGARFQLKVIFTDAELEGDPVVEKTLCVQCGNCIRICPAGALSPGKDNSPYAVKDEELCRRYVSRLEKAYCDCAACIKVCPPGADRQLFNSNDFEKYFDEAAELERDPNAEAYQSWIHLRSYGSADLKDVPEETHG
jgi:epoxyqueuosine reductase QueG